MDFFVIGDVMLDIDYQGKHRDNEEGADLCITSANPKMYSGGAAWVARLLAGYDHNVDLFGVVGPDGEAEELVASLPRRVASHFKPLLTCTTVKRRVYTAQGIYRFDMENTKPISWPVLNATDAIYEGIVPDCVLFVDYNKGVFSDTHEVQLAVGALCQIAPAIAAIKPTSYLSLWQYAKLVVCNEKEADAISLDAWANFVAAGTYFVVTRGDKGVMVYDPFLRPPIPVPSVIQKGQVVGAGDAFLAALVPRWFCDNDLTAAVEFAAERAGQYVGMGRDRIEKEYFAKGSSLND